jgi:hypothetical protein
VLLRSCWRRPRVSNGSFCKATGRLLIR